MRRSYLWKLDAAVSSSILAVGEEGTRGVWFGLWSGALERELHREPLLLQELQALSLQDVLFEQSDPMPASYRARLTQHNAMHNCTATLQTRLHLPLM